MKNLLKFGFLALAVSMSVAACTSNKTDGTDTDTTIMTDTTMMDTTVLDTSDTTRL